MRLIALTVAAIAAFAAVAVAGNGYGLVTKTTTVAAGTSGGTTAKCPDGSQVAGGGFSIESGDKRGITNFIPVSKRKFAASAANGIGQDPLELDVIAVCDGDANFEVVEAEVEVPNQETKSAKARCPAGTTVVGGGLQAVGETWRYLRSSPKGERKWVVSAAYFTKGSGTLVARAICDKDARDYEVETKRKAAPPVRERGIQATVSATAECENGLMPASGGFRVAGTGNLGIFNSEPVGDGWRIKADTYAGKDLTFTAFAVCGAG